MEVRTYEAYGGWWPSSDAVARTAYAGYVIEPDVSWYLLGLRFYVPWLRRFISPDAASPFDAGGFNRYAYGSGDPVNRIDPSGNASFGWLGRLLGHLIGTVTDAAGAVVQGTPTTALSAISRAAEVVSVATSIGAVTAVALDEAPAAGILGWIAGGSGLARLGLGVAGQVVGKSAGRTSGGFDLASGRARKEYAETPGVVGAAAGPFGLKQDKYKLHRHVHAASGKTVNRYAFTRSGITKTMTKHRTFAKTTTEGVSGETKHLEPNWQEVPNSAGGVNYLADSKVTPRDTHAQIQRIAANHGGDGSKPILLLFGVHGDVLGTGNWSSGDRGMFRANASDVVDAAFRGQSTWDKFSEAAAGRHVSGRLIGGISPDRLKGYMDRDAHIIHASCFSAADPVVMDHLGVNSVDVFHLI